MTIDGRRKQQYFKNLYGLNDVYVWKEAKNNYGVGINGTSNHYGGLTKYEAEVQVSILIFAKN
ncbi:MAG: hypothetical protein CMH22_06035 [Methylophaga sp.]|nr:hypothetical protein [Methylophaga sp.]|tara:strand:+ start:59078 stop:59266 length:189 start_codon:yes stop_codon:yes gene_type:complete